MHQQDLATDIGRADDVVTAEIMSWFVALSLLLPMSTMTVTVKHPLT